MDYLPDFLKWREFDIYITLVETFKEKTAPKNFMEIVEDIMLEFQDRIDSGKHIVPLPDDLEIWFPKF